ncbi:MAG: bifunctional (p)ppGpp synthetase/guanosine-3',5'-bis(diphosphate) 3'-pyrophosphohydrolase [Anaerolineae bacterium]|nr:bifunctional (p)ppGpp synthetase/guanosine-3',5'-bis(diphosphate) 3'-pyrophosphohydrolase [Anaerolineae bacterium]
MVDILPVHSLRPSIADEFNPGEFIPRTESIAAAFAWGQKVHAGQKRISGEPYFETHCAWVAAFLDRLVGNEAWTIAGLLHDAVEDSGESLDQIRTLFPGKLGEDVAYIVDGVTKLSNPRDGRSREMETLRKIAMFRDPGVFLVKLADKSHNLLTLEHMSPAKRVQKATEAIRAYGKLAGILNCHKWRCWLEDMAFPFAEPDTYTDVRARVDADPRLQISFINPFMDQLSHLMEKTGVSGSVNILVNGYWQSWQKLRRMARARKAPLTSFMHLNDLISFRLVVDDEDRAQCYNLLGAVNTFFGPYLDNDRFDDFIAFPQNGYRAIQVTGWLPDYGAVEVAIATREMEGENTWGVVDCIKKQRDTSLYRPVEILTPSGGARFLREGSTVLDAVASIQQEFLLDKISAVKVNGNLARLSDRVNPGDVVEVVTSGKRLVPSEDWLNFCNESTARLLRLVLATESLKRSAEHGRQLVREIIAAQGILTLEDVQALETNRVDFLLEQLGCASLEDLYTAVGGGAIPLDDLRSKLYDAKITRETLHWTTINLNAPKEDNRPGVLARLAGLVSDHEANILRSVNNTLPDGGFYLRLVVSFVEDEQQRAALQKAFLHSGFHFRELEIV